MRLSVRTADQEDIAEIARLFLRSRLFALPKVPILHSAAQDRAHLLDLYKRGTILVAVFDTKIVGFLVGLEEWIAHLYVDPEHVRQQIGTALLADIKQRQPRLELWCFEQNMVARAFYEAQGFKLVRTTDGDNEERLPDRLYRWVRGAV